MRPLLCGLALAMVALAGVEDDAELFKVREAVWRSWFANDVKGLEKLVPEGTVVISSGEKQWKNRADVLRTAAEFHAEGGKLIRLEFPRNEVQHYGAVVIVHSRYVLELEVGGKRKVSSGRVTEVFVKTHGQWTNPSWHTDEEPE